VGEGEAQGTCPVLQHAFSQLERSAATRDLSEVFLRVSDHANNMEMTRTLYQHDFNVGICFVSGYKETLVKEVMLTCY
jgi:hypothetical protein